MARVTPKFFIFFLRFFKFIFRILRHPLILIAATVWFIISAFKSGSLSSISFSPSLGLIDTEFIVWIAVFSWYGLGVGYHITKRTIKTEALPTLFTSILWAAGTFYYLFLSNKFQTINALVVIMFLLMFISAGTAVDTIIGYLCSREPGPLLPSVRVKIRSGGTFVTRSITWIRNHRFIFSLIILQLIFNAFFLYRLSDVETRTGGSLFTMCNADQTIKSINNSIVRIVSEEGEGTGMIIREDGYILTNAHVIVEDPSPKIIFSDYSFKTSEVIFRDTEKDIAVLKVDGTGYVPLMFGDPKGMPSGTALYSVGFPLGTALRGDATVAKFTFVAVRSIKDYTTTMVQLDGVGTGGASGGPVITSCGEVVGMFTAGTEGISFAISSTSLQETLEFLSGDPSTWPDPPEFALEPDKSAEEAVRSYYTFIKMRNFKRAYLMLTPERVKDNPLDNWVKGYAKTLDVTLISLEKEDISPTPTPPPAGGSTPKAGEPPSGILETQRIFVKIRSLDLEGQDVVVRYFEGPWIVVWDGEFWRLSDSNIKPVPEPGNDWFW